MEIFLIRALQLVLALSILILLHEGGHFFFAKLFGIRVEKFYLFFDPWFHLFQFKPKKSDTTYGIGWLPLGGYCKIAGMIDESFDTEQMKQPAQPSGNKAVCPSTRRLYLCVQDCAPTRSDRHRPPCGVTASEGTCPADPPATDGTPAAPPGQRPAYQMCSDGSQHGTSHRGFSS